MTLNIVEKIDESVEIKNVLISVSNKTGLGDFALDLIDINPEIKIFSTGGTFAFIQEVITKEFDQKKALKNLIQVSDYTGQPETQGGLVKTLDFKVYLGLLTETYNELHQKDLERTGAVPIDMVVVNLYPFKKTIAKPDVTLEQARGNIDIGGPCMIRASAKNFIRVASVVDPEDYFQISLELDERNGFLGLETRFELAQKAFKHTAVYDQTIADFLGSKTWEDARECYSDIQ